MRETAVVAVGGIGRVDITVDEKSFHYSESGSISAAAASVVIFVL